MNYTDADIKRLIDRVNYLERLPTFEYIPWTDYSASSTVVGWSSYTNKKIKYKNVGKTIRVQFHIDGTSDSAVATFTFPYTPEMAVYSSCVWVVNNGVNQTNSGLVVQSGGTVTVYRDGATTAYTASGNKIVSGQYEFEIA
jgi:hypothetical protein